MHAEEVFPAGGRAVWKIGLPLARGLGRLLFSLDIQGRERIPRSGPAVVAANHLSHLDPVFLGTLGLTIRYLALDELYGKSRVFDRLTIYLGAIPLPARRGVPLGALRLALRTLAEGGVVGLFPEGRRVGAWGDSPPKRGAAWLAFRSGAPLLPVALEGTGHVLPVGVNRPSIAPVRITVGPLLDPLAYTDRIDPVDAMTEEWRRWMDGAIGDTDSSGTAASAESSS